MNNILIINREWEEHFKDIANRYSIVKYTNNSFSNTIREVVLSPGNYTSLVVVTDYHPELPEILNKNQQLDHKTLIKVEPIPFTHPFCHFSGLFLFSMLWLLNHPEIISTHSYMLFIPGGFLTVPEINHILGEAHTPAAFNLGMFALAIRKKLPAKSLRLSPYRNPDTFYEVLKNEFIHSTATLMKVLEIKGSKSDTQKNAPDLPLNRDEKIRIPGHPFLTKEFTSGFRRYAPFWKEHLFEDHFALLSEIYSGKEDTAIDDRTWIRIMLELINVSFKFTDKAKIARRIFPIYALYLKTIHETPIGDKFTNYLEILQEESKFLKS